MDTSDLDTNSRSSPETLATQSDGKSTKLSNLAKKKRVLLKSLSDLDLNYSHSDENDENIEDGDDKEHNYEDTSDHETKLEYHKFSRRYKRHSKTSSQGVLFDYPSRHASNNPTNRFHRTVKFQSNPLVVSPTTTTTNITPSQSQNQNQNQNRIQVPSRSKYQDNSSEVAALIALYNFTNGKYWRTAKNWSVRQIVTDSEKEIRYDLHEWHGIEIDDLGHVVEVRLLMNELKGFIPPAFCELPHLCYLDLSNNHIEGSIPDNIYKLSNLRELKLHYNQLTGVIPESIGRMISLRGIHLEGNHLTGSIPHCIGNLKHLIKINIAYSMLSGPIPSSLENLTSLTELKLNNNKLTGEIPSTLGKLRKLKLLYLHDNKLSGTIPASLSEIPALTKLWLNNNPLEGVLPPQFYNCSPKLHLRIENTRIKGPNTILALRRRKIRQRCQLLIYGLFIFFLSVEIVLIFGFYISSPLYRFTTGNCSYHDSIHSIKFCHHLIMDRPFYVPSKVSIPSIIQFLQSISEEISNVPSIETVSLRYHGWNQSSFPLIYPLLLPSSAVTNNCIGEESGQNEEDSSSISSVQVCSDGLTSLPLFPNLRQIRLEGNRLTGNDLGISGNDLTKVNNYTVYYEGYGQKRIEIILSNEMERYLGSTIFLRLYLIYRDRISSWWKSLRPLIMYPSQLARHILLTSTFEYTNAPSWIKLNHSSTQSKDSPALTSSLSPSQVLSSLTGYTDISKIQNYQRKIEYLQSFFENKCSSLQPDESMLKGLVLMGVEDITDFYYVTEDDLKIISISIIKFRKLRKCICEWFQSQQLSDSKRVDLDHDQSDRSKLAEDTSTVKLDDIPSICKASS